MSKKFVIEFENEVGRVILVTPEQKLYNMLPKNHTWRIYCESVGKLSEYHMFTIIGICKEDLSSYCKDIIWNPCAKVHYYARTLSKSTEYWLELTDEECRIIYHDYSKYKAPIKEA